MKLSIVGLPIGNVEDISVRAIRTISESQLLVCEDTRMFYSLWSKLENLGLAQKYTGKVIYANDFNEEKILSKVISESVGKERIVLVSDAGMPLISDPGYRLVRFAIEANWEITVVPGPTAESSAMAISGLAPDKYLFVGFLTKKPGKRLNQLREVLQMMEVVKFSAVFYESPLRTVRLLEELEEVFGTNLNVAVTMDLTKISEKVYRGKVNIVREEIASKPVKGEVAIVIHQ